MSSEVIVGNHRLFNADCLEVMRSLPDKSVDFILTDIPYELHPAGGIGERHSFSKCKAYARGESSSLAFVSNGIDYDSIFSEFVRLLKVMNACIFCSNKQIGKIMTWWESRGYTATLLVWDKPNPMPLGGGHYISNLEFIVYVKDKGATFNNLGYSLQLKTFRYNTPAAKGRIHETEKPVSLLKHLLMLHTKEGDVVLDPYAGSFSTAEACCLLNRKFIGCEVLEKYFVPGVKRVKMASVTQVLFR